MVPVGRLTDHRRRLLVWFREDGEAIQVAVAAYIDGEKRDERTWVPEPFDEIGELGRLCLRALDEQLRLW